MQVNAASGSRTCREAEDAELKPACAVSCRDACRDGLAAYTSRSSSELGFKVPFFSLKTSFLLCNGLAWYTVISTFNISAQ